MPFTREQGARRLFRAWLRDLSAEINFLFREGILTTMRIVDRASVNAVVAYPGPVNDPQQLAQVVHDFRLWVHYVDGSIERVYNRENWRCSDAVRRMLYVQHLRPGSLTTRHSVPNLVIVVTLYSKEQ